MSVGKVVGTHDQYRIGESIAKGAFSVVYRCADLRTGQTHAIKVVNRKLAERQHMTEALIREVNAMEVVGESPFVIHLVDKLVSKHNYYIIMELAEGGTLLDMIKEKRSSGYYSWIAPFFKQLLIGLDDMHSNNVVHRDIKPENILLNKQKTRILISDFGFACYSRKNHELHRACGTLRYCAPELLTETPRYEGRKVDVWAAGVTLYVMFCGTHPFPVRVGVDPETLLETITRTTIDYPRHVPAAARDLMQKMLVVDPKSRWSARRLLEHPWIRDVNARLDGDAGDGGLGVRILRCRSSSCYSNIGSASLLEPNTRPPSTAGTPDDRELTPSPTLLNLDSADDGFYFHQSDGSDGEESFEHFGDSQSDEEAVFAYNGTSGSMSQRESLGLMGNRSPSSRRSGSLSASGPLGLVDVGASADSSRGAASLHRRHAVPTGGEETDYDVVFEGLFVRPRVYLRGVSLTICAVVRFLFFCCALLLAAALRVFFDMDVSDLPLPRFVRDVLADLVVPPHERQHRHRVAAQQQQEGEEEEHQQRGRVGGPSGAAQRPPLPPLRHEGLLSSRRGGRDGDNIASPTPGSQLRRYVREAERMLNSSFSNISSAHEHPHQSPNEAARSVKNDSLTKGKEVSDEGHRENGVSTSSSSGGGAVSPESSDLRQRRKAPQPQTLDGDALSEIDVQPPKPVGQSSVSSQEHASHTPRQPMTSLSSPLPKSLSATLAPVRASTSTSHLASESAPTTNLPRDEARSGAGLPSLFSGLPPPGQGAENGKEQKGRDSEKEGGDRGVLAECAHEEVA